MQKYNKKAIRKNFSGKYFKKPDAGVRILAIFTWKIGACTALRIPFYGRRGRRPAKAFSENERIMAVFRVEGGHSLQGEITPQGAKNEALQILCATLLTPERVVVRNVPRILDVMQLIELLRRMGVEVEELGGDAYAFRAREIDFGYLRTDDYRRRCTRLRGSVMLIGPMLARFGMGYMPKPGGDKIGRRRLDTHFLGFQ